MPISETIQHNDHDAFPGALPDRRNWPRSSTAEVPARLAWRTRGLRMRKVSAELIEISEGGARLSTHAAVQQGLSFFWVGLKSLPCEWVKASIQEVVRHDLDCVYRVQFLELCPAGMLELACSGRI
jgi:hypothetical protein